MTACSNSASRRLLAYLLGALLGSLVLGRLRGVDIRALGSGNAGATNALRTQGKMFGLLVLIIDMGKGVLAVRWLPHAALPGVGIDPAAVARVADHRRAALAVVVGHVYPVWFGFRGGKGAATVVGVIAAMEPRLLAPLLVSWIAVLLLTGYVGLATMLAGVALVIAVYMHRARQPADARLLRGAGGVHRVHPSQQHRPHASPARKIA